MSPTFTSEKDKLWQGANRPMVFKARALPLYNADLLLLDPSRRYMIYILKRQTLAGPEMPISVFECILITRTRTEFESLSPI